MLILRQRIYCTWIKSHQIFIVDLYEEPTIMKLVQTFTGIHHTCPNT